MDDEKTPTRPLPLVLSILPTRAEIEDTAAWTEQPSQDSHSQQPHLPPDVLRMIEKAQARRASGKTGKTFTTQEARKMFGLPPA